MTSRFINCVADVRGICGDLGITFQLIENPMGTMFMGLNFENHDPDVIYLCESNNIPKEISAAVYNNVIGDALFLKGMTTKLIMYGSTTRAGFRAILIEDIASCCVCLEEDQTERRRSCPQCSSEVCMRCSLKISLTEERIAIRLFAFIAGGGGGRGEQFSTPVGDHVHVSRAKTLMFYG